MIKNDQDPSEFSLLTELKKRKTQKLQQAHLEKKTAQPILGTRDQSTSAPLQSNHSTPNRRTVELQPVIQPTNTSTIKQIGHRPRVIEILYEHFTLQQLIIGGFIGLMLCVIGIGLVLTQSTGKGQSITPTIPAAPIVHANEVLDYLKNKSFAFANVKTLNVPNQMWAADSGFELTMAQRPQSMLILLTFASEAQASKQLLKTTFDPTFKSWQSAQISTVIALFSPEVDRTIQTQIENYLTQIIIDPYRELGSVMRDN